MTRSVSVYSELDVYRRENFENIIIVDEFCIAVQATDFAMQNRKVAATEKSKECLQREQSYGNYLFQPQRITI